MNNNKEYRRNRYRNDADFRLRAKLSSAKWRKNNPEYYKKYYSERKISNENLEFGWINPKNKPPVGLELLLFTIFDVVVIGYFSENGYRKSNGNLINIKFWSHIPSPFSSTEP